MDDRIDAVAKAIWAEMVNWPPRFYTWEDFRGTAEAVLKAMEEASPTYTIAVGDSRLALAPEVRHHIDPTGRWFTSSADPGLLNADGMASLAAIQARHQATHEARRARDREIFEKAAADVFNRGYRHHDPSPQLAEMAKTVDAARQEASYRPFDKPHWKG